jgi:hypothetical protein
MHRHPNDSFGIIRMADYTANMRSANGAPAGSGLFTVIIIILAGIALYYLYTFLTKDVASDKVVLVPGKHAANTVPEKLPKMPTPYDGGEYTFSTWLYVNSFNTNMNRRKHVFEIKGTNNYSTLLVALGAFKNTLVVRTHNKDVNESFQSFQGAVIPKVIRAEEGFAAAEAPVEGNLSAKNVETMFNAMTTEDSLSDPKTMCDLPEIDMQRWVMVTVVLSGRTIDVYLDGKLARSCVTKSYFKVDPTGVSPKISDHKGFDGYVSQMSVANYAMNPAEIYRMYIAGPEGATLDIVDWFKSLFSSSA